ncbi:MAG: alpha/beta hydrolase [Thermoanaerobaculia bacterium]
MSDVLGQTPPPADERLRYGPDPLQFVDVRLPTGPRTGLSAALINIHGGFWRAKYDLLHASPLCAALAESGIATFNLEYRRVGDPGGGWPGSYDDVLEGYRFVRGLAASHRLDPDRILVMGHSAGGQLALCLAAHAPELRAAISLAGVLDLRRAFDLHLSNDAVVEFVGGTPQQVDERYRQASPMEGSVPSSVRQLIVHGSKDDTVPPSFSRDYGTRKRELGEDVELLELADAGHFDVIEPTSAAWKTIEQAILRLAAASPVRDHPTP